MKHVKKLVGMLLVLAMVLSFGISAFAAEAEKGSVTINGALKGNTFTLYKIFDLDSYNAANNTYAYTIRNDSPLYNTVKNMTLKTGTPLQDKNVFALTSKDVDTDYVQLSVPFSNTQNDDATIKAIASELMRAINDLDETTRKNLIVRQIDRLGGDTESTIPDDGTGIEITDVAGENSKSNIKFTNLDLGYYLIDSSAGTMIGLTTTNPNAELTAKNELPNVVKEVKKNVDGTWDKSNTKVIGETVNYRFKVGVRNGATNYVVYDSLSEGLTYDKITKVYYGYENNPAASYVIYDASKTTPIDDSTIQEYFKYEEATADAPITHKDLEKNTVKNCCFKMTFTDEFLSQVLTETGTEAGYQPTIFVEYDAKLNENAVIGDAGNPNDVYLTYGENDVDVAHDTVKTTTYEMELVKTKDDNTVLTGAEFEVYTQRTLTEVAAVGLNQTETLSGKLTFIKSTEGGKTVYRVATQAEIDDTNIETVTTIEAGDVIIRGLGGNYQSDTSGANVGRSYYFKETKAPDGYTLTPTSTEFKIGQVNELAQIADGKWVSGGLQIINKSGGLLPSTGGIGTTIFYVVGSILLIGAAVLLITKKRMSSAK